MSYYNLFSRLEAGVLWGTRILVFSGVLWTKQQGGRDVPCRFQKHPRGRLHRPFQQQEPLLPRITVQRQPKLHHWKHSQTHRQRFVESFQFFLFLSLMRFWGSEIDRKHSCSEKMKLLIIFHQLIQFQEKVIQKLKSPLALLHCFMAPDSAGQSTLHFRKPARQIESTLSKCCLFSGRGMSVTVPVLERH